MFLEPFVGTGYHNLNLPTGAFFPNFHLPLFTKSLVYNHIQNTQYIMRYDV